MKNGLMAVVLMLVLGLFVAAFSLTAAILLCKK